jgi:hypothetical protein
MGKIGRCPEGKNIFLKMKVIPKWRKFDIFYWVNGIGKCSK